MFPRRIILFFLLFATHFVSKAQHWRTANISVGLMDYAVPFSKFGSLFIPPLHPKISLGVTYQWNKNQRSQILQNASIGFGYHRFVQSIIPVNTEIGYRHQFSNSLFLEGFIGGGYIHSFSQNSSYVLTNGTYVKTGKFGRPQGMINARIGIGLLLTENMLCEFSYENMFQTNFVAAYVPLLPYNIFNITYSVTLDTFRHKTNNEKARTRVPKF